MEQLAIRDHVKGFQAALILNKNWRVWEATVVALTGRRAATYDRYLARRNNC